MSPPQDPTRSPAHRELMAVADAAAQGVLAGRSAEIEAARRLPDDIATALADAGLYRLLTPRAYGGHEAPPASFFLVTERLAQADAAAAWCAFISSTTALLAAWLPPDSARRLFAPPGLKTAGVFAPRGRAAPEARDGVPGWRVSGRWAWGSGVANADLVSAGCLQLDADGRPVALPEALGGGPRVLSVLLPRAAVQRLDTWDAFGLCGTGSGEFTVTDAWVPAAHAASLFDPPQLDAPLYRFPVFGLLAVAIAAVASGIAGQALAHFGDLAGRSVPQAGSKPLAARATVQAAVAQAHAQWQGARHYLLAALAEAWDGAQAGQPPSAAARAAMRLAATHATHAAAAVVQRVHGLAGGGAVFAASPLQRALRDVHVATQHMMVGESTWELTGRVLLGVPTNTATL